MRFYESQITTPVFIRNFREVKVFEIPFDFCDFGDTMVNSCYGLLRPDTRSILCGPKSCCDACLQ
jgi:hypothetical protein